jgi:transposase
VRGFLCDPERFGHLPVNVSNIDVIRNIVGMELCNFVFRFSPSRIHQKRLEIEFEFSREMTNMLIEHCRTKYESTGKPPTKSDLCNKVKETKDLNIKFVGVHSQILQNSAYRVSKAYDAFFRRLSKKKSGMNLKVGHPRFKKHLNSYTNPQGGFNLLSESLLYVSKFGNGPIGLHRPILGQIKTMTVVKKRDRGKCMFYSPVKWITRTLLIRIQILQWASMSEWKSIRHCQMGQIFRIPNV